MRLGSPGRLAVAIGVSSLLCAGGQSIFVGRGLQAAPPSAGTTPSRTRAAGPHVALVDEYCLSCHDKDHEKGQLVLETIAGDDIAEHADVWEKVVRKLRARLMPPVG